MNNSSLTKVLIHSDDTTFSLELRNRLKTYGMDLHFFNDKLNMLELLRSQDMDILMVSLNISGYFDLSLIGTIRDACPEIEVILLAEANDNIPSMDAIIEQNIHGIHIRSNSENDLFLQILSARKICLQKKQVHSLLAEKEILNMNLKQIHEALIDNERLYFMGRILGSITHNMKTPLMCIGTSIQSLKDLINEYSVSIGDSLVTNDDHCDIAKDMEVQVDNIYQYLVYLKDLALALKDQTVSRSISQYNSFTIDDLLKRLNIILNDQLKICRCTMNSKYKMDSNTIIKGKLISLIQVISNLIINSAEAYEDGGTIDFTIDEQNGKILFIITDFAGGIPNYIKEKLFKELVTTKGKAGTGIGVYSSYQTIKKDFMGDIEVVSEEGKGTTFTISIPHS